MEDVRTDVTATWEELLHDIHHVIYATSVHEYETAWDAFPLDAHLFAKGLLESM